MGEGKVSGLGRDPNMRSTNLPEAAHPGEVRTAAVDKPGAKVTIFQAPFRAGGTGIVVLMHSSESARV